MNIIIGWILGVVGVLWGYVETGGKLETLWVPEEFLIIGAAVIGAIVVANKSRDLKLLLSSIRLAFLPNAFSRHHNLRVLCLIHELLVKVQRQGQIAVESDIDNPYTSQIFQQYSEVLKNKRLLEFITDYFRMMADGSLKINQLESVIKQEIGTIETEFVGPAKTLYTVADSLPAFGIVAAIIGVIKALLSVGTASPGAVGGALAAALVGTLTGVFLSYAVAAPLGAAVEKNSENQLQLYEAISEILIAYYKGFSPYIAVEYGRKALFSNSRPSASELEATIRSYYSSSNQKS